MKRVILFVMTNIAVLAVITILLSLLGLNGSMYGKNLNLSAVLAASAVIGFAGAIISLLMSKWVAKWSTGARVINPQSPSGQTEAWLIQRVYALADKAGIGKPEVAIYQGEPNAFATGAFRNSALVAVSTGLLQDMTPDEVEAVLAHEVAHIANGDMVTMTLIQGVLNTFVIFFARIVGWFVDRQILKNENDAPGIGYFVTNIACQILFGILASIIVAWFSRQREYRADAGAAELLGNPQPMINALSRLGGLEAGELPKNMAAMGISEPKSLLSLFASHPPIEQRIKALQQSK